MARNGRATNRSMAKYFDQLRSFSKWVHQCAAGVEARTIGDEEARSWLVTDVVYTPPNESGKRSRHVANMLKVPKPLYMPRSGHVIDRADEVLLVHYWAGRGSSRIVQPSEMRYLWVLVKVAS